MEKKDSKSIKENIKWFKKFTWKERLEIAFREMKAIKILRNISPKSHAKPN